MLQLFDHLRASDAGKLPGARHLSFQLSEAEINDYLRFSLRQMPRPGLESVTVKLFSYNYVSIFAIVDFDAVERWKPGTIPLLMRPVLSGKKSIWTDFRFQVQGSRLMFRVEKAYFQKFRLPAVLVQQVIRIMAARQPEKYDTSKPVPLPFGLRNVWTREHSVYGEK
jgi:hypothetical protein